MSPNNGTTDLLIERLVAIADAIDGKTEATSDKTGDRLRDALARIAGFFGENELHTAAVKNVKESNAGTVAALKNDFNALLLGMKEAGIMEPDGWNVAIRLAPSLTDAVAAANNAKASAVFADGVITISADVDDLEESTSSVAAQGTHKWIGLGIGTGLSSVTLVKYNGSQLTADDAAEAASVGLTNDGEFVLYVKADEVVNTPKTIKLKADGHAEIEIQIKVVNG